MTANFCGTCSQDLRTGEREPEKVDSPDRHDPVGESAPNNTEIPGGELGDDRGGRSDSANVPVVTEPDKRAGGVGRFVSGFLFGDETDE